MAGSTAAMRQPVARLNRPSGARRASCTSPPNSSRRRRVGLLGGSFNPAHQGHLAISLEALRRLRLDQVWWLVSPQNPLKSHDEMADLPIRMAAAERIAAGHPQLLVTDLEQRLGTRYTVDTVRRLRRGKEIDYVLLIGADNLMQLPQWRCWLDLLKLVPIAVFDREPYSYQALAGRVAGAFAARRIRAREAADLVRAHPPAWVYFRLRRHRASSTAIRNRRTWPIGLADQTTVSAQGGQTEGASS